ncbi:J domain-containing protein [Haloarchaeobius sp. HME9146]|uniref:J domain-containing protein n=1 Tax=Haloarchaeobius sp. HME9146 TaxID=2978732 RepID=UPI0021BF1244|nr:J domain-containing protein [Haloarchaeobius sp. HME9146]
MALPVVDTGFGWVTTLPSWLLAGLSLGALFAVLSATMFVAGEYLFPEPAGYTRDSNRNLSSEARRREEIRWYLDAIGEQYAEDHPVAGDTVAFYLPARDVAVTFDAHAFFRIQQTDTYAVLCEHEMHGHHLGARLPFEVPEIDWEVDEPDEGDVITQAFRALGLPPSASTDEVRAAYRERVMETHPDHGGSEESFRRVREAYTTAKEHAAD